MKPEIKKLLILNLPYLLFVWLFDKVGAAVRLSPGADASAKLLHLGDGFTTAFSSIAPSFHPADLALGIAGAVIVRLIIYTKGKNAKKYRRGTEYGSARWGGADDIKPYTDPVFENNIPLTQTERLTMNSRPKQPKYARNKNILVIGGSGSGKTRFFVKPSLMQCTSKDFPTSYIVTDPKGTLILETGKMLQRYKYRIKVLNTINFKKSMKYNPFAYLRSEKDILKLVNTIIANTKGDGEKSGEDFWVKAEKLYYTALIGYIWYEAPEDEKNFTTLLEMINASEARVVSNKSIKMAGDDLTNDIVEYMRRQHNIRVSERMAERIKINVGSALSILEDAPEDFEVCGPNQMTALPMKVPVSYQEIAHCLDKSISKIEAAVLSALEQTPPELYADIVKNGIYLAGGGALLRGIDKRLRDKMGIEFHVADDPLHAVARGTGIALKNIDKFNFLIR